MMKSMTFCSCSLNMTEKSQWYSTYNSVAILYANSDKFSKHKFEKSLTRRGIDVSHLLESKKLKYIPIGRSRNVGQSFITSIFTTLKAMMECVLVYFQNMPDMVISTGPGTALPIIYISYIFGKIMLIKIKTKIVFFESIWRINSISLTGKLVYPIWDRFYVHWKELHEKYPKSILIEDRVLF